MLLLAKLIVWLPALTELLEHNVLVSELDGVLSMPPKTIREPPLKEIAPSVSKAAAGEPVPLALPGPLTMTVPPVWTNVPLLSMPSVSPLVGTQTSNKPPLTVTLGDDLPLVALTPSSVADTYVSPPLTLIKLASSPSYAVVTSVLPPVIFNV